MKTSIPFIMFLPLLAFGATGAPCQTRPGKRVNEIRNMIKRAQNDDDKTSGPAMDELSKLTVDSIPNLFEIVKKDGPCTAVGAAGVITTLYPDLS